MTQRSNYFTVSAFNNDSHFSFIDSPRILPSFLLSLSTHTLRIPSTPSEIDADTVDSENDHQAEE
jgi:hypothetical protein